MGPEHKTYQSSSRELRNIAEKMRRDKLNHYVTELAAIVPLVSAAAKRVDKTSVLRLAANFIRVHNSLGHTKDVAMPAHLEAVISKHLSEAIGGFLLVVTSTGKIVYVTEAMERFFGHSQVDILGKSILKVIHPEDHHILKEQLLPRDNPRRSFFCRMTEKALSRNDPNHYEIIHIVGTLRPLPVPAAPETSASPNPHSVGGASGCESPGSEGSQSTTSSIVPQSLDADNSDSEGEECSSVECGPRGGTGTHMLVAFVRVVKDRPITELSLVEATQDEYITRHSMDGKILYTDHRISFVTGLMPQEVLGTSAFTYMHPDDMVWSLVAQKIMFSSSEGQGLVSYRLRCRGGTFVTLRSRGYIEVNKKLGHAETFVCINTVVSNKDAMTEIKRQRKKLLPMVMGSPGEDHLDNMTAQITPDILESLKHLTKSENVEEIISGLTPKTRVPSESQWMRPARKRAAVDSSSSNPIKKFLPDCNQQIFAQGQQICSRKQDPATDLPSCSVPPHQREVDSLRSLFPAETPKSSLPSNHDNTRRRNDLDVTPATHNRVKVPKNDMPDVNSLETLWMEKNTQYLSKTSLQRRLSLATQPYRESCLNPTYTHQYHRQQHQTLESHQISSKGHNALQQSDPKMQIESIQYGCRRQGQIIAQNGLPNTLYSDFGTNTLIHQTTFHHRQKFNENHEISPLRSLLEQQDVGVSWKDRHTFSSQEPPSAYNT